ncbi:MAG: hypothetical protein ACOYJC_07785 [Christensenellales bacterium]|jgi:hypothetical protein
MKKLFVMLLVLMLLVIFLAGCGAPAAEISPTVAISEVSTPTPTLSLTAEPTPAPTSTPEPTPAPTSTPEPTPPPWKNVDHEVISFMVPNDTTVDKESYKNPPCTVLIIHASALPEDRVIFILNNGISLLKEVSNEELITSDIEQKSFKDVAIAGARDVKILSEGISTYNDMRMLSLEYSSSMEDIGTMYYKSLGFLYRDQYYYMQVTCMDDNKETKALIEEVLNTISFH